MALSGDVCPKGDTSGSSYDGKCAKNLETSSISVVNFTAPKSGLFSANSIVSAYNFPENERIPQKVAAELNFLVTHLQRIIDKKAGDNEQKKDMYRKTVAKYIMDRAKKTTNKREKRILVYLFKRFSVITKTVIQ